MSDSRPRRFSRVSITTVIALVLTTGVSTAVIAAHNFTDVPDSNTFHEDIEWLAENKVTIGCNPPDNTQFCPDDNVTREQMSAFMRRLSQTFGAVGEQVTGFSSPIDVTETTYTELLTVDVTPKAEATVLLNAHANIEVAAGEEGRFEVIIARDSCTGTIVGSGTWRVHQDETAFPTTTLSITGTDTVEENTTYALCAAKDAPGSLDGRVLRRGLTANWAPTG